MNILPSHSELTELDLPSFSELLPVESNIDREVSTLVLPIFDDLRIIQRDRHINGNVELDLPVFSETVASQNFEHVIPELEMPVIHLPTTSHTLDASVEVNLCLPHFQPPIIPVPEETLTATSLEFPSFAPISTTVSTDRHAKLSKIQDCTSQHPIVKQLDTLSIEKTYEEIFREALAYGSLEDIRMLKRHSLLKTRFLRNQFTGLIRNVSVLMPQSAFSRFSLENDQEQIDLLAKFCTELLLINKWEDLRLRPNPWSQHINALKYPDQDLLYQKELLRFKDAVYCVVSEILHQEQELAQKFGSEQKDLVSLEVALPLLKAHILVETQNLCFRDIRQASLLDFAPWEDREPFPVTTTKLENPGKQVELRTIDKNLAALQGEKPAAYQLQDYTEQVLSLHESNIQEVILKTKYLLALGRVYSKFSTLTALKRSISWIELAMITLSDQENKEKEDALLKECYETRGIVWLKIGELLKTKNDPFLVRKRIDASYRDFHFSAPLTLEKAVQGDKVMQDFELESFAMGADPSQMVKAAPIANGNGSKDCANLSPSAAVFRMIQGNEKNFVRKVKQAAKVTQDINISLLALSEVINNDPDYAEAHYIAMLKQLEKEPPQLIEDIEQVIKMFHTFELAAFYKSTLKDSKDGLGLNLIRERLDLSFYLRVVELNLKAVNQNFVLGKKQTGKRVRECHVKALLFSCRGIHDCERLQNFKAIGKSSKITATSPASSREKSAAKDKLDDFPIANFKDKKLEFLIKRAHIYGCLHLKHCQAIDLEAAIALAKQDHPRFLDPALHYALGCVYQELNRLQEAKEQFDIIRFSNPPLSKKVKKLIYKANKQLEKPHAQKSESLPQEQENVLIQFQDENIQEECLEILRDHFKANAKVHPNRSVPLWETFVQQVENATNLKEFCETILSTVLPTAKITPTKLLRLAELSNVILKDIKDLDQIKAYLLDALNAYHEEEIRCQDEIVEKLEQAKGAVIKAEAFLNFKTLLKTKLTEGERIRPGSSSRGKIFTLASQLKEAAIDNHYVLKTLSEIIGEQVSNDLEIVEEEIAEILDQALEIEIKPPQIKNHILQIQGHNIFLSYVQKTIKELLDKHKTIHEVHLTGVNIYIDSSIKWHGINVAIGGEYGEFLLGTGIVGQKTPSEHLKIEINLSGKQGVDGAILNLGPAAAGNNPCDDGSNGLLGNDGAGGQPGGDLCIKTTVPLVGFHKEIIKSICLSGGAGGKGSHGQEGGHGAHGIAGAVARITVERDDPAGHRSTRHGDIRRGGKGKQSGNGGRGGHAGSGGKGGLSGRLLVDVAVGDLKAHIQQENGRDGADGKPGAGGIAGLGAPDGQDYLIVRYSKWKKEERLFGCEFYCTGKYWKREDWVEGSSLEQTIKRNQGKEKGRGKTVQEQARKRNEQKKNHLAQELFSTNLVHHLHTEAASNKAYAFNEVVDRRAVAHETEEIVCEQLANKQRKIKDIETLQHTTATQLKQTQSQQQAQTHHSRVAAFTPPNTKGNHKKNIEVFFKSPERDKNNLLPFQACSPIRHVMDGALQIHDVEYAMHEVNMTHGLNMPAIAKLLHKIAELSEKSSIDGEKKKRLLIVLEQHIESIPLSVACQGFDQVREACQDIVDGERVNSAIFKKSQALAPFVKDLEEEKDAINQAYSETMQEINLKISILRFLIHDDLLFSLLLHPKDRMKNELWFNRRLRTKVNLLVGILKTSPSSQENCLKFAQQKVKELRGESFRSQLKTDRKQLQGQLSMLKRDQRWILDNLPEISEQGISPRECLAQGMMLEKIYEHCSKAWAKIPLTSTTTTENRTPLTNDDQPVLTKNTLINGLTEETGVEAELELTEEELKLTEEGKAKLELIEKEEKEKEAEFAFNWQWVLGQGRLFDQLRKQVHKEDQHSIERLLLQISHETKFLESDIEIKKELMGVMHSSGCFSAIPRLQALHFNMIAEIAHLPTPENDSDNCILDYNKTLQAAVVNQEKVKELPDLLMHVVEKIPFNTGFLVPCCVGLDHFPFLPPQLLKLYSTINFLDEKNLSDSEKEVKQECLEKTRRTLCSNLEGDYRLILQEQRDLNEDLLKHQKDLVTKISDIIKNSQILYPEDHIAKLVIWIKYLDEYFEGEKCDDTQGDRKILYVMASDYFFTEMQTKNTEQALANFQKWLRERYNDLHKGTADLNTLTSILTILRNPHEDKTGALESLNALYWREVLPYTSAGKELSILTFLEGVEVDEEVAALLKLKFDEGMIHEECDTINRKLQAIREKKAENLEACVRDIQAKLSDEALSPNLADVYPIAGLKSLKISGNVAPLTVEENPHIEDDFNSTIKLTEFLEAFEKRVHVNEITNEDAHALKDLKELLKHLKEGDTSQLKTRIDQLELNIIQFRDSKDKRKEEMIQSFLKTIQTLNSIKKSSLNLSKDPFAQQIAKNLDQLEQALSACDVLMGEDSLMAIVNTLIKHFKAQKTSVDLYLLAQVFWILPRLKNPSIFGKIITEKLPEDWAVALLETHCWETVQPLLIQKAYELPPANLSRMNDGQKEEWIGNTLKEKEIQCQTCFNDFKEALAGLLSAPCLQAQDKVLLLRLIADHLGSFNKGNAGIRIDSFIHLIKTYMSSSHILEKLSRELSSPDSMIAQTLFQPSYESFKYALTTVWLHATLEPSILTLSPAHRQKLISSLLEIETLKKEDTMQKVVASLKNGFLNHAVVECITQFAQGSWEIDKPSLEFLKNRSISDKWYMEIERYAAAQREKPRDLKTLVAIMAQESDGINRSIKDLLIGDKPQLQTDIEGIKAEFEAIKEWTANQIVAWVISVRGEHFMDDPQRLKKGIAVASRASQIAYKYPLRDTQLITLWLMLRKENGQRHGRIGQMATGEGKSIVFACLDVLLAMSKMYVNTTTTSTVLAEREPPDKEKLFKLFGLTVSNNCDMECELNEQSRKGRYFSEGKPTDIIYGDIASFERDLLLTEFYGKEIIHTSRLGSNCIAVDEIDGLFLDNASMVLYLSHDVDSMRFVERIFAHIWALANHPSMDRATAFDDKAVETISKMLKEKIDSKEDIPLPKYQIPNARFMEMRTVIERKLSLWIRSALYAKTLQENNEYIIIDQIVRGKKNKSVTVMDKGTGVEQLSLKWSNGLHQFLQLKHGLELSPEGFKAIFLSNYFFFKQFGHDIFGLTGTLGSATEQRYLEDLYDVELFKVPRFREEKFIQYKPTVVGDINEWFKSIDASLKKEVKERKRSVLIITDSIEEANMLVASLKSQYPLIHTYTSSFNQLLFLSSEKANLVGPGEIIIATNLAGRGSDFKTSQKLEAYGGLHVLLTYLPQNIRIQEQALRRTARAGNEGSGEIIVFDPQRRPFEELCRERDLGEKQRLENVASKEIKKIGFENDLLRGFKHNGEQIVGFQTILNHIKEALKNEEAFYQEAQLNSLKNRWSFWLDHHDEKITMVYALGKEHVIASFKEFSGGVLADFHAGGMRLIKEPVEMIKLGGEYRRRKKWSEAASCYAEAGKDPHYAYALYYQAACELIKAPTASFAAKMHFKTNAKKAGKAIDTEIAQLQTCLHNVTPLVERRRLKEGDADFGNPYKARYEERIQIWSIFRSAIQSAIGGSLSPDRLKESPFVKGEEGSKILNSLNKDYYVPTRLSKKLRIEGDKIFYDNKAILIPKIFKSVIPHLKAGKEIDKNLLKTYCKGVVTEETTDEACDVLWTILENQGVIKLAKIKVLQSYKRQIESIKNDLKTNLNDQHAVDSVFEIIDSSIGMVYKLDNKKTIAQFAAIMRKHFHDHRQHAPEGLSYFIELGLEVIVDLMEKKDPPHWYEILTITALAVTQMVAGTIVKAYLPVIGEFLGNSLMNSGMDDVMFAVTSVMNREFSWDEYSKAKKASLKRSFITSAITSGVSFGVNAIKLGSMNKAWQVQKLSEVQKAALAGKIVPGTFNIGSHIGKEVGRSLISMGITQLASFGFEKMTKVFSECYQDKVSESIKKAVNAHWHHVVIQTQALYHKVGGDPSITRNLQSCLELSLKKIGHSNAFDGVMRASKHVLPQASSLIGNKGWSGFISHAPDLAHLGVSVAKLSRLVEDNVHALAREVRETKDRKENMNPAQRISLIECNASLEGIKSRYIEQLTMAFNGVLSSAVYAPLISLGAQYLANKQKELLIPLSEQERLTQSVEDLSKILDTEANVDNAFYDRDLRRWRNANNEVILTNEVLKKVPVNSEETIEILQQQYGSLLKIYKDQDDQLYVQRPTRNEYAQGIRDGKASSDPEFVSLCKLVGKNITVQTPDGKFKTYFQNGEIIVSNQKKMGKQTINLKVEGDKKNGIQHVTVEGSKGLIRASGNDCLYEAVRQATGKRKSISQLRDGTADILNNNNSCKRFYHDWSLSKQPKQFVGKERNVGTRAEGPLQVGFGLGEMGLGWYTAGQKGSAATGLGCLPIVYGSDIGGGVGVRACSNVKLFQKALAGPHKRFELIPDRARSLASSQTTGNVALSNVSIALNAAEVVTTAYMGGSPGYWKVDATLTLCQNIAQDRSVSGIFNGVIEVFAGHLLTKNPVIGAAVVGSSLYANNVSQKFIDKNVDNLNAQAAAFRVEASKPKTGWIQGVALMEMAADAQIQANDLQATDSIIRTVDNTAKTVVDLFKIQNSK